MLRPAADAARGNRSSVISHPEAYMFIVRISSSEDAEMYASCLLTRERVTLFPYNTNPDMALNRQLERKSKA